MGGPNTNTKGQIQRRGTDDVLGRFLLERLAPQIKLALPKHLDADRMARIALTALRTTPKLSQCSVESFGACVLQLAQLGLEPSTPLGHAYLIPRKAKNRGMECTIIVGYRGFLELARRSGQVSSIYAFTVHTGDTFRYSLGLDPTIEHEPGDAERNAGNMTHVYAVAKLKGGDQDRQFVVLSKREVEQRKGRGAGGPAWRTDYLAMAKKTAVRALFTWLPSSPEMAYGQRIDAAPEHGASILDVAQPEVLDAIEAEGFDVAPKAEPEASAGDAAEPAELGFLRNASNRDTFLAAVKANAAWISANQEAAWKVIDARCAVLDLPSVEVEALVDETLAAGQG